MRLALKPEAPDAQPRKTLAGAIAEAQKLQGLADAARTAFERAQKFVTQTQAAYEAAAEALDAAAAAEGERLASALTTGAPTGAASAVRDARQRVSDAEDDVRAAKAALAKLREAAVDPGDDARRARERVKEAAAAVVETYVGDMLADVSRLQVELGERRAMLREAKSGLDYRTEAYRKIESFLAARPFPIEWEGSFDHCASVIEWRSAMEALSGDAKAPLPVLSRKGDEGRLKF